MVLVAVTHGQQHVGHARLLTQHLQKEEILVIAVTILIPIKDLALVLIVTDLLSTTLVVVVKVHARQITGVVVSAEREGVSVADHFKDGADLLTHVRVVSVGGIATVNVVQEQIRVAEVIINAVQMVVV